MRGSIDKGSLRHPKKTSFKVSHLNVCRLTINGVKKKKYIIFLNLESWETGWSQEIKVQWCRYIGVRARLCGITGSMRAKLMHQRRHWLINIFQICDILGKDGDKIFLQGIYASQT